MENIKLYEIDSRYIDYLAETEPHLFHNKKPGQQNERKFIGVVLKVNGMDYFVPLSSFKPKHYKMKESTDFIKIKDYAVININNMFPAPLSVCTYIDINMQKNPKYKSLLLAEYRYIKSIQEKIRKNAETLYNLKVVKKEKSPLTDRCNNFEQLEKSCAEYTEVAG